MSLHDAGPASGRHGDTVIVVTTTSSSTPAVDVAGSTLQARDEVL